VHVYFCKLVCISTNAYWCLCVYVGVCVCVCVFANLCVVRVHICVYVYM
jgi:hypothetical protein